MYDYQDGLKKNNVGFARVEARNDQCKIMINIKAPSLNNNTLKAYIFYRNDDVIRPLPIGNMIIRNGIGDLKAITKAGNILNSSYTLDQMCGIIVYFNDGKYYATEWDDKPVILRNFNNDELIVGEKVPILDREAEENCDDLNTNEMETKKESINEVIKDFVEEMIEEDKKEDFEEVAKESIKEVFEDNIKDTIADVIENIKDGIEDIFEDNKKESIKERENLDKAEKEEKSDNKETIHKEDAAVLEKEEITSPIAARIFSRYTKMFPFEGNEIAECVKIEPQDIGAFPIENWVLGNNSFLLHGYYNYKHLIFARKRCENGNQYIIGVPGFFQSREKFMAKLFGFEDFKPTKEKEPEQGEFGYWYTTINL